MTTNGPFLRYLDARKRVRELESFFRRFGAVYPPVGQILARCPTEQGTGQCGFLRSAWRPHEGGGEALNELREKEALDRWVIDYHDALAECRFTRQALTAEQLAFLGEEPGDKP